jgi:hypothetical protein
MRIPNKFNGYMSDGRRLYPDPATSTIIASALAKGTAAATVAAPTITAAAVPTLATAAGTSAIPGIVGGANAALSAAAPTATTAASTLGTTAQAMSPEIAANVVQGQAAQQGIMNSAGQLTGAGDQAALGLNQVGAVNPIGPNAPDIATKSLELPETAYQQTGGKGLNPYIQNSTQPLKANPGMEVGQANLQAPTADPTAGLKPPPSAFDRGVAAAQKFAGDVSKFSTDHPYITTGGIMLAQNMMQPSYSAPAKKSYKGSSGSGGDSDFKYGEASTGKYTPIFEPTPYAVGGSVERMSAQNAVGSNTMYPQSQLQTPMYSNPMVQRPMPTNVISPSGDAGVDMYSGEQRMADGGKVSAFERMMKEEEARRKQAEAQARSDIEEGKSIASRGVKPYSRTQSTNTPYAAAVKELQAMGKKYGIKTAAPAKTNVDLMGDQDQIEYAANGGIMHGLGGYSDGGRLLKGPGDGVSDSIPAVIGSKQPARLADGEFVIPARIVSELGNGSTEAGARKLYAMMERVQKQRRKTVGKNKVAVNSKADKHLPA